MAPDAAQIPIDLNHDVVIVVPTVADRATLAPTVARLVADAKAEHDRFDGLRVAIVLSVNGPDPIESRQVAEEAIAFAGDNEVALIVHHEDRPIGFSAANNRGLMAAIREWGGCAELVVFHNDDAHVPIGFARRMIETLRSKVVHGYSEFWSEAGGLRKDRATEDYGRIGLIGPLSNLVAGIQQIAHLEFPDGRKATYRGNVEQFDAAISARFGGQKVTADFLSGFCVGMARECIADLMLYREAGGPLLALDDDPRAADAVGPWDEDQYPIAGYEDNDLCVRAELLGWRCVVAADLFVGHVGHQTFDRLFPEQLRGMRNRAAYYERWRHLTRPEGGHRIAAVYRLRFEVAHDIYLLRLSLLRISELVDSIAVVLTANPLDVLEDPRWREDRALLRPEDDAMLRACDGAQAPQVADALRGWISALLATHSGRLGSTPEEIASRVVVDVWSGEFNERTERNRSIELAEGMEPAPTWILSVDHDEVVENRVERWLLDRLCSHPDPLVRAYDQSWVNHWDSERLLRVDQPWGDGGSWGGGMHGYRLFRAGGRRRIFAGTENGLHCGNVPDHDSTSKRISGIRFRHYGYLRVEDRVRKHRRYKEQDPNPDPSLTGNGGPDAYGHLIHDEGMTLSPFSPLNGIGLAVLLHPGERADDLARLLDQIHGVVDRVVVVWTAGWDPEDVEAVLLPAAPEDLARQVERDALIVRYEEWMAANAGAGGQRPKRPSRLIAARRVRPDHEQERAEDGGMSDYEARGTAWPTDAPSQEVLAVAEAFGAEWIHHPLEDDLAAARNAGLDALSLRSSGLGWSLFMDLDEVFPEPFGALVALRRMAEASDTDAWLFPFANLHGDGTSSRSESYRLARLLPSMRLTGRVHETYDVALGAIEDAGRTPRTRVAPFEVTHLGLSKTDEKMDEKLARYRRLLLLELRDRPHGAAGWVALGLALENDGNIRQAQECYQRSVLCPGPGYLGYRELGMFLLRQAVPLLAEALNRSKGYSWHRANEGLVRYLLTHVPPLPILGSARVGRPAEPDPIDLPAFPMPVFKEATDAGGE